MGCHGAPQPIRWLKVAGEHVAILVVQGGDGWPARRWQFGRRCHAGGAEERNWGKEGADRRVPPVSDGGAVTEGRPAHTQRWASTL
jgi:hypothetical protein